ncbi:MAG TPA: hypothetical protein VE863_13005 [Pyrinomonadaceae bacterium]|jgi:urease beta subunit|nr:hypothetical protein [Pyrinomonadaceae bacterium]
MKSLRKLTPFFKLLYASVVLAIALVLLYKGASGPTNAQQSQPQERQVENTVPKNVPLDVKLTKEKEKNWKDLKNENWARDFEVEVTNTGDRPIYFFGFSLYFDVPNNDQENFRADIAYGRPEISRIGSKPTAADVPLKPGESKILTLQPGDASWLEWGRREKGWRLPTKVRIKIGGLNFGDGTGFILDQPFPRSGRSPETSKLENINSQPRRRKRTNVEWRSATSNGRTRSQKNHTTLPAVLPVSYFMGSTLTAADAAYVFDDCEPGCFPLASDYSPPCYGCEARLNYWYTTSGTCGKIQNSISYCMDTGEGQKEPCPVTDAIVCVGSLGAGAHADTNRDAITNAAA